MPVKKASPLRAKIAKIEDALKELGFDVADTETGAMSTIFDIFDFQTKDIPRELKTHSGIYAYLAVQKANYEERQDNLEFQLTRIGKTKTAILDILLSLIRNDFSGRLTEKMAGEIKSLIEMKRFVGSEYYHSLSNDKDVKDIKELLMRYGQLENEQNALEQERVDVRAKIRLLTEITTAIAFQKNMALKSLVDLHITGINQEINR